MTLAFRTRKLVKSEDLNGRGTLFGGRVLAWIDEECCIYCACQMGTHNIVTKYISELNFVSAAYQNEVVELGVETVAVGRTSLAVRCVVRNKDTQQPIVTVERVVFVALDAAGHPANHALSDLADTARGAERGAA